MILSLLLLKRVATLIIGLVSTKKRNWKEYNEALVRRGEILLDTDFLSSWQEELGKMNDGKEGARYRYPDSFVKLLATIHAYLLRKHSAYAEESIGHRKLGR